ncbi:hypothetical protein [Rhodoblastus sp.]|uniref:hypothetical protein n=1 Tax=Rhodoblastus sp. TaxID=1962975 RepID=UPI0035B1ED08
MMRVFKRRIAGALARAFVLGGLFFAGALNVAYADDYCAGGAGRSEAVNTPPQLAARVAATFGISVEMARDATMVRCVGTKLLTCWVGANLNCGKADKRRALPGAKAYCRQNPGSDSIPMAATGHDTIYEWRCAGRRAVAGKVITAVDAQGFVAENWRAAP